METIIANKIIKENGREIVYQFNTPIYDNKGYFTHKFDNSNPDIITLIKEPKEWMTMKD